MAKMKKSGIKVRATKRGLYGDVLREKNDEFTITDKSELGSWMEVLGEESAPVEGKGEE